MPDTKMPKSAGEFWTCSVLARLGWAPALTRDGVERTNILATDTATRQVVQIQVKAATGTAEVKWHLGKDAENVSTTKNEWFVLCALPAVAAAPGVGCEVASVRSFVVPRNHVSAGVWLAYHDWLLDPSVPVGRRTTPLSRARIYEWVFEGYAERWDLLGQSTAGVMPLLPKRFRALATQANIGLPPLHPWRRRLPRW